MNSNAVHIRIHSALDDMPIRLDVQELFYFPEEDFDLLMALVNLADGIGTSFQVVGDDRWQALVFIASDRDPA